MVAGLTDHPSAGRLLRLARCPKTGAGLLAVGRWAESAPDTVFQAGSLAKNAELVRKLISKTDVS
jgi:hypothetical protein